MKLLLDNNLSPKLVSKLLDVAPDATHVSSLGLEAASDSEICDQARRAGMTIVMKDSDFNDLAVVNGFPPKVVLIRIGNCTTSQAETLIRSNLEQIADFIDDPFSGLLTLL